jgi:hypothetical protein
MKLLVNTFRFSEFIADQVLKTITHLKFIYLFCKKATAWQVYRNFRADESLNALKLIAKCLQNNGKDYQRSKLTHLVCNNLIIKHQHAFLKNRSTATNLRECTEYWIDALTNRRSVDVIYVDLKPCV